MPNEIEIERKFLVDKTKVFNYIEKSKDAIILDIEQVYLQLGETEIRLRKTINQLGNVSYVRTTKTGHGMVRGEVEEVSSIEEYSKTIQAYNLIVNKTRYVVGNMEIDFYRNGLVTMEIEYPSEEAANNDKVDFDFIEKEITGDKYYSNASIAKRGV